MDLQQIMEQLRSLGISVNPALALVVGLIVAWVRNRTTMGDANAPARQRTVILTLALAFVMVALLDLAVRGNTITWDVQVTAGVIASWLATAALAAGGRSLIKGGAGK
ncbi:MAG: hypothetical protein WC683_09930 [bacterium]